MPRLNATKAFRLKTLISRSEFVSGNGGDILEEFESFNSFCAEFPEHLVARLKSHEDIEDVELDVLAINQLSSSEEALAHPGRDDAVSLEKKRLIRHLGLETTLSRHPSRVAHTVPSLFFIESLAHSTRNKRCKMPTSELFRGVNVGGILDGNYLVPGGVKRLVLEWKVTHGKWAEKRDGLYDESKEKLPADFESLLRQAGSAAYQAKIPDGMDRYEYYDLITTLAPNESEGPDDKSEWKLFNGYLDSDAQVLDNPYDLSRML
ncbi:uncharacterized protein N7458_000596 [Penicillium daleae]|uniref:Uncharacterized protein n=1 Tax=Penicillium daleae TaxID=63821 RepID=A0AAD6CH36_9EURO|nr:uncharacterized protein N7458_000596 [Penicillium daleae]KAJ5464910.1 hypothetical protein N7458_000596 [Penicillium daleae]